MVVAAEAAVVAAVAVAAVAVAAVAVVDSSRSCRIFRDRPLTWLQRHLLYRRA